MLWTYSSLWLLTGACAAQASHISGYGFLLDGGSNQHSEPRHASADSAVARLILAQRMGLSRFHHLPDATEETIGLVNGFGGPPQQFFGRDASNKDQSRVMLWVDGLEHPQSQIPILDRFDSLSISSVPHPSEALQLFSSFCAEAKQLGKAPMPGSRVTVALSSLHWLEQSMVKSYDGRSLVHIKVSPPLDTQHRSQVTALNDAIVKLHALSLTGDLTLSVVFMPPEWLFSERAADASSAHAHIKRGHAPSPLEAPLTSPETTPQAPKVKAAQAPQKPQTSKTSLAGAVPTCFASLSACKSGTNNCTGHGECLLKYKGSGSASGDCYGCLCTIPEVRKNKDGSKKTTRFGGAACQKKDIVMPFWLLAGTSIFIVSIVSWGIGLLYSMGNEDLPSVIGAGVSGPRSK
ncbi:hypothetical protein EJ06DRAFT_289864 [Trichodelitschia bisporula]|uniref:Uncharacterized protein n=1 Tax=Trichodelitschia bisporula TaxID=703511 RepID=A0A6G1I5Y9_9PEZI|nr:hypothetical protein EJ06DRAFT_289864 [Trichodelitschia bisporula]